MLRQVVKIEGRHKTNSFCVLCIQFFILVSFNTVHKKHIRLAEPAVILGGFDVDEPPRFHSNVIEMKLCHLLKSMSIFCVSSVYLLCIL